MAGLLAITAALGGPLHLGSDDTYMAAISAGTASPATGPSPFVLFMHPLLGALIVALNGVTPAIAWHDWLQIALNAACCMVIAHVWLGAGRRGSSLANATIAAAVLVPFMLIAQFTMTAFLALTAAGVLWLGALQPRLNGRQVALRGVCGAGLAVVAFMVRKEAAGLGLEVLAAASLPLMSPKLRRSRRFWAMVAAGLVSVGVWAWLYQVELQLYGDAPGWQRGVRYNLLRAQLVEYVLNKPMTPAAWDKLLAATGWTTNDVAMLRDWLFIDPNVFSEARLHRALAATTGARGSWPNATSLPRMTADLWRLLRHPALWSGLAAVAIAALYARRGWRGVGVAIAVAALPLIVLQITLKPIGTHLMWGICGLVAATTAMIARLKSGVPSDSRSWGPVNRMDRWIIAAAALVAIGGVARLGVQASRIAGWRADVRADLADVAALRPTALFTHGDAMGIHHAIEPFSPPRLAAVPLVSIGVAALTPLLQDVVRKADQPDVIALLCGDERALVVAEQRALRLMTTWMWQHHRRRVRFTTALRGRKLLVSRCGSVDR